jgi:hypothetical protein
MHYHMHQKTSHREQIDFECVLRGSDRGDEEHSWQRRERQLMHVRFLDLHPNRFDINKMLEVHIKVLVV